MSTRPVGVIGLGAMGLGVARSLLRAGFHTHACDVRPEVLQQFESEGGVACASPAALGAACEVVVIVVVNADQTEAVLFGDKGAASTLRAGSVVLASATVLPEFAERLGERLAERGILLIDAPLSGGAAKAAEGEMTMMTSGSAEAFAKSEDVLAAIAGKVYRLGDRPGQGSCWDCGKALIPTRSMRSLPIALATRGCLRIVCRTSSQTTTRRFRPWTSS